MYKYVRHSRRLGASGSAAAGTLGRPLPIADVRTDPGCEAGPRPDLQAAAAAARGRLVDRNGVPGTDPAHTSKSRMFFVRCASSTAAGRVRLAASASPPAAGCAGRCSRVPLRPARGDTWGEPRRGSWCGAKAEHGGPRWLLHPLSLPSRRGGMILVDWIGGLSTTAHGLDSTRSCYVDLL